jgi:hypothetical protein
MLAATGVAGAVVIDPAKPVCMAGQSCSAPDANETVAFSRNGRRVATARTDALGRFSVRLAPGVYRLTLPRRTSPARLTPLSVRVPDARIVHVTLRVDIGIR